MGIKINQLPDLPAVTGTDMFPADNAGGTTGKHTLTKIANFAVNAFTLSLGGVTRTVKAAIDAFQTLLGSTDIIGVGDGTVTGAISSLNNDLANIGTVKTGYLTTTTSIPDNTATALTGCSVTLTPGVWIIIGKVTYQGGTAGTYRQARIGTTATGNEYGLVQFDAASNNRSAMIAAVATESASRTFYLSTQHGNGSATPAAGGRWNTFIEAVRIA